MLFCCIGLATIFNDATPDQRQLNLKSPPAVPTVVWNLVGVVAAVHYFSAAGRMDLFAEIGFLLYGLIGAVLIYVTVRMKRDNQGLTRNAWRRDMRA